MANRPTPRVPPDLLKDFNAMRSLLGILAPDERRKFTQELGALRTASPDGSANGVEREPGDALVEFLSDDGAVAQVAEAFLKARGKWGEAVRYTSTNAMDIGIFTEGLACPTEASLTTRVDPEHKVLTIPFPGQGEQRVGYGDWVVKVPDGSFSVVRDDGEWVSGGSPEPEPELDRRIRLRLAMAIAVKLFTTGDGVRAARLKLLGPKPVHGVLGEDLGGWGFEPAVKQIATAIAEFEGGAS